MSEVAPFRGILYSAGEGELPKLLAPPYDIISPALQAELYARDPHNVVRIVLNRSPGEEAYQEAGETFRRWLAEKVLAQEAEPVLYLLEQAFALGDRRLRRYGLLARFRVEDLSTGKVLAHVETRIAPVEDRFRLLLSTAANFSPIFLVFRDNGCFAARVAMVLAERPFLAVTDEQGVRHRVWRISDPGHLSAFREALRPTRTLIADGHHRYSAALRYRDRFGPERGWTYGYFTPFDAPGLVVLPYHRILLKGPSLEEARRSLQSSFALTPFPSLSAAAQAVAESQAPYAFGLADPPGGALVAEATQASLLDAFAPGTPAALKALDVCFVHHVVLSRFLSVGEDALRFVHSLSEVEQTLAGGHCRLALLMRAVPLARIQDVAEAGLSLPHKATLFYPKLPSGLVIHPLPA